jgi:hypothetical protein
MTSALVEPIAVEFPYAGGWYPGVLLGWRQNDGGRTCRLRVRCVIGGLRRTTWMSLADLRLPEPPAVPSCDAPPSAYTTPRPRTGERAFTTA